MATDRRAFREEQTSRLIDAILHQPPVPPRALNPRLSTELETIILKCLDKEPERRYQSATELLVDLRRLEPSSSGYTPPNPRLVWGRIAKMIGYGAVGLLSLPVGLAATNVGGWRDRLLGRPRAPRIFASHGWLLIADPENLTEQEFFRVGDEKPAVAGKYPRSA